MAGRIFTGEPAEKIKPPPIAGTPINIAPVSLLPWEDKEISPGESTIIDTWGYTYVTLWVEVNRPARLTLAAVSRDGIKWRPVSGGFIKAFDTAGNAFIPLHEAIEAKEVLLYRFLKIRVDAEAPIRITLESTSKLLDLLPVLSRIKVMVEATAGIRPMPPVIKTPEVVVKPPEVPPVPPEFKPLVDAVAALQEPILKELVDIHTLTGEVKKKKTILEELIDTHTLLKDRFTNAVAWDHDQKNITTPGTPLQLPGLVVPDGYALVIEAKSGNAGNIYLGNSKDAALETTKRKTLEPKDTTTLEVKKASAIWIDADNADEGVEFWTERLTEV